MTQNVQFYLQIGKAAAILISYLSINWGWIHVDYAVTMHLMYETLKVNCRFLKKQRDSQL